MTSFTAISTYAAHAFEWENRKMSINGEKIARNEQMDRIFMFMEIFWTQRVVCRCPGAIYTRQIKFSNFRNIRQSLHIMNKSHILEYGKW